MINNKYKEHIYLISLYNKIKYIHKKNGRMRQYNKKIIK